MTVWQQLFTRRMLICVFIGFSSGLPLYLLFSLLPAWLRSEHVDLKTIGLFALIQFPYTWKFLWSPLLDRYVLPLLGRRRASRPAMMRTNCTWSMISASRSAEVKVIVGRTIRRQGGRRKARSTSAPAALCASPCLIPPRASTAGSHAG